MSGERGQSNSPQVLHHYTEQAHQGRQQVLNRKASEKETTASSPKPSSVPESSREDAGDGAGGARDRVTNSKREAHALWSTMHLPTLRRL